MLFEDRNRAESFGLHAEVYDRVRPTYPSDLLDVILGPGRSGRRVLDVGCGTGIVARQMADRGAAVLGVEIDARMADVARRRGVEVEVARFEAWDPAGRTFDAVTAGQAWHWVDPTAGAEKAASVLRPGGCLAVFWNQGRPPADLAGALEDVYGRIAPSTDQYSVLLGYARQDQYLAEIDGIRRCERLSDPIVSEFPWARSYSRDEWVEQLPTHSDHARLPTEVRARLLAAVGEVIDGYGGSFVMQFQSVLVAAKRLAG